MVRVYAIEETGGKRLAVRIECDAPNCQESIAPDPHISSSGWVVRGQDHGPGTYKIRLYYCPIHADL